MSCTGTASVSGGSGTTGSVWSLCPPEVHPQSYPFFNNPTVISDGDAVAFTVGLLPSTGEKIATNVYPLHSGTREATPCSACGGSGHAAPASPVADIAALRDGRYEGGNHELYIDLRVDGGVCGVVSADLYRVDAGRRNYVASIRTLPGQRVSVAESSWAIAGQDEHGGRSGGQLTLTSQNAAQGIVLGTLLLESALQGLPSRVPISFVAQYVSEQLRQVGIEMEVETGIRLAEPYTFRDRQVTIESSLHDAGFETFTTGLTTAIPPKPEGWDSAELHTLMQDLSQSPLTRRTWDLHLLMLSRPVAKERGLLGVMFDTTETLPRQGAAVFVEEIRSLQGIDHDRKIIQTAVHELGHALNLAHRFERAVGRADSTSFMNYDWRYRGGDRRTEFWNRFSFTFDADELEFLRHAPLPPLIPGGAAFHSVNYWADGNGGYSPYLPEAPLADFELRLSPPANGGVFKFGQPVFLKVALLNRTGAPQHLPKFLLDPKAGFLEVLIRRRTNESVPGFANATSFVPIVQRCFEWSASDVQPVPDGEKIEENLNLTFGSGGFAFAEPGTYDVTAFLIVNDQMRRRELVARSETQIVRIAAPKTDLDEADALVLFREDVGLYMALGGSPALSKAAGDLAELAERRQGKARTVTDPVVAGIRRAQAIEALRSYVRYEKSRFYEVPSRPADVTKALRHLTPSVLKATFDPVTAEDTLRLIKQVDAASEPDALDSAGDSPP